MISEYVKRWTPELSPEVKNIDWEDVVSDVLLDLRQQIGEDGIAMLACALFGDEIENEKTEI